MNEKKDNGKTIELTVQEDVTVKDEVDVLRFPVGSTSAQITASTTMSLGIDVPQGEKEYFKETIEGSSKLGLTKFTFSFMELFKIEVERAPKEIIIKYHKEEPPKK